MAQYRGARPSRDSRASAVPTDDSIAKGSELGSVTNMITMLSRPFEFLPLRLKSDGGVFETSEVFSKPLLS